jgi:RNA polymerase sigma factor (sigma-70 family)
MHADTEARELTELVHRWSSGDQDALEVLMLRYGRLVVTAARRGGVSAVEAEDVAQETWLSFLIHAGDIRDPARLASWLWTTSARFAMRRSRCARRTVPTADVEPSDHRAGDDVEDLAARSALRDERRAAVQDAIGSVPVSQRELLDLLLAEDSPCYRDISRATGRPIGSIGPTRRRLLDKLRTHPRLIALYAA